MKMLFKVSAIVCGFVSVSHVQAQTGNPIYKSAAYSVYADGVKQNKFSAHAVSATELTSDYQSPKNESVSSKIVFKFSINGKDNEMKPGVNHIFNFVGGVSETPVIKFGQPITAGKDKKEVGLKPDSKLKIRLDLSKVLQDIKTIGYYTTVNGDKIYKDDFKKVYVAGAAAPLSWDFDNLHQKPELEMKDNNGDGIFEATLVFNAKKDQKQTAGNWKLTKNIAPFPQFKSDYLLKDALYNLSLEEMVNSVEPDSTFRTGKEWAGVWTRDISYSIILSMAYLQPKVAMNSLMRKVTADKRIIQDTGTGGAYPASTDRIVWAVAAWEVYKATGDKKWLENAYVIIKNSIDDDYLNAYDQQTGLVRGESSFLDWREQTYPKWMQPADIFESQNLGTNAVHYQANMIVAEMAKILNHKAVAKKHLGYAEQIKNGINTYLWLPEKGYYAQFRYGKNFKIVSPRAEALGEALCILFGIADDKKAESIVANTPVTDYGMSCIYPQIPDMPPYHNNAVWPFVQSYWTLASAKAGNEAAVFESMMAIDRPAALFLTNKENFVADNGDFAGTEINSSNMLWSLSGSIGMVHKVLFGIGFESDRLVFKPFVPEALKGTQSLTNFTYRQAVFDITIEGFGNKIKTFLLDGKTTKPEVLGSLKGKHVIHMVLENNQSDAKINKARNVFSPATPQVTFSEGTFQWENVSGASSYQVLRNGEQISTGTETSISPALDGLYSEWQVIAVSKDGVESFASEPIINSDASLIAVYEAETMASPSNLAYKGFTGNGFVETSKTVQPSIQFTVNIKDGGAYAFDFRYANGNGPTNTENKCAIRSLKEGDKFLGTFVFPQRGVQEWSNWGFSNSVQVWLERGSHTLTLSLDPANANMNGEINQAMLDYLRVSKIH